MSGLPAARLGDGIICAIPQATPAALPHAPPPGLPIIPPCAASVLIGGQPAARVGDMSLCVAPVPTPNPILRGSFTVPIMGMPAARLSDSGTHPGSLIAPPCCPTVLIGLAGVAGNVFVGTQICNAAASGRGSGSTSQSYNNCGVESSRQIINQATGTNLSENQLLNQAITAGIANGTPGSPPVLANGGTDPFTRQTLLANNGVASTVVATTPDAMGTALAQGRGVIVGVDIAPVWGPPTPPGSGHAMMVTGVEYDDAGNRTHVIVNDTGNGNCGSRIPAATFDQAVNAWPSKLNITNNPVF